MPPEVTQIGAGVAVAERIRAGGPIRVDQFLDLALYHPEHGFYMRGGGAGRQRDFLTSPEVGPLYGAVLARAIDSWWDELGRPDPFAVVDVGAAAGTLARSIRAAEPGCAGAMKLVLVEVSPVLRAAHPDGVDSRKDLPAPGELGAGPVIVLANELLDNLAFRLAERAEDGWAEVRIGLAGDHLVETTAPLPEADVERCDRLAPGAARGRRVPLPDRARAWLTDALALAGSGRLVVADYAAPTTAGLAARPWTDWVRTYTSHGRGAGPWDHPGAQDVTCELAVDQLAAVRPPTANRSQAEFLRSWGLADLVADGRRIWAERSGVGDLAAVRGRSRIGEADALTDPAGLGAFRVLEWVD